MKGLKISFGILLLIFFVGVGFLSATTVGKYVGIDKYQSASMSSVISNDTVVNTIQLIALGFVIGLFIYSTRLKTEVVGAGSVMARKARGTVDLLAEYNNSDEPPTESGPASEDDGK
jgi:hypothetical protein